MLEPWNHNAVVRVPGAQRDQASLLAYLGNARGVERGCIEVDGVAPLRVRRNDGGDAKPIIQVQFVGNLPVILDELLKQLAPPDSECLGANLGILVCQAECQVSYAYAGGCAVAGPWVSE